MKPGGAVVVRDIVRPVNRLDSWVRMNLLTPRYNRTQRRMFAESVRLVLGCFHLGDKSEAEIDAILKDFKRLEVKQVAPCHCTGEYAISRFAAEYGKDFVPAGIGSVIRLEASTSK